MVSTSSIILQCRSYTIKIIGLEFLERLIELDAADNCISEHKKLIVLAHLHHLTTVMLCVMYVNTANVLPHCVTVVFEWKPIVFSLILPKRNLYLFIVLSRP